MENILLVFGGLAMFIYSINTMSEGLKKTTGEKLKTLIEKLTSNRLLEYSWCCCYYDYSKQYCRQ